MSTKGYTSSAVLVMAEPKIGPEPQGIKYCLRCLEPIEPGDHWRKISRGGGACAVGLHDRCLPQPPPYR